MEFVYVVPRGELFPDCYPQGWMAFGEGVDREPFERVVAEHGFFVERAHAELQPSLKQPIPYCIVTVGEHVFLLRRTRNGGEARLHDKLSIGVGGHVNPIDGEAADGVDRPRAELLLAAARREIEEELVVDGSLELRPLGLLNDDSNPVGAVHVGFVFHAQVEGSVRVRELDQLEGRLATPAELEGLLADGANFETWSAHLVRHLTALLTPARGGSSAERAVPLA